ncbi:MAG TPA: hypothetical protein VGS78_04830 [Candidatus Sulfotelmatobacter sp.]|nr:hypothetical protein [Candidatus Sulfotelmatobacter sp.]
MTLEELANTLPSGFHDSALKKLSIDYERRTLRLDVSLKVGNSDGPLEQRNDVRDACIEISGLLFFVVDPPSTDIGYDVKSPGELWIVDGYETRLIPEFAKTITRDLMEALPTQAFVHSFFINEWNSYIHIAARDCALKWAGEAKHYRGPRQAFSPGETVEP